MAILLRVVGAAVVFVGLMVLAYDGYVEDAGMEPSRTWDKAFPLLALAAGLFVAADRLARRDGRPPTWVEQVTGHGNLFWGLLLLGALVGLKTLSLVAGDSNSVMGPLLLVVVAGGLLGWIVVKLMRQFQRP